MKRKNLDLRSFHDNNFSLKNKASAMQFLVETLTARNLTRDEMQTRRIEISLMILIQSLLTID
jgi:uncharacterized protein YutE (UPF0331/DUF86 family)